MRIVLDTNIIVSALISPYGAPAQLLDAVRRRELQLVTSAAQLDELADVIARPRIQKYLTPGAVQTFMETVSSLADIILSLLPDVAVSVDPDDNAILATALAGNAELIISGDKRHVLSLGTFQDIPIVTAAAALERIAQARGPISEM